MNGKLVRSITVVCLFLLVIVGAYRFLSPCAGGCNVILIMVDTLSAKHIALYGYDRDTMPETSAFFENGVIFDNATAGAPWTLPSFLSMYYSDLPTNITYADLDSPRRNLPSELRKNDVTLRAVIPSAHNFLIDAITRPFADEEKIGPQAGQDTFSLAKDELEKLLLENKPFFLLAHTFEVHDPYDPNPPYVEMFGTTDEYPVVTMRHLLTENSKPAVDEELAEVFELRYDQNLREADKNIAAFLRSIPESALKNTVVILSADHGEAFGEHGKVWHGNSVYQEVLHVPLMMHIPGVQGKRITHPVSLLDLSPTILSFMDIGTPREFTGRNLVPLVSGASLGERAVRFVNGMPYFLKEVTPDMKPAPTLEATGAEGSAEPIIEPTMYGVRWGADKAFVMLNRDPSTRRHWYNLAVDPEETDNLFEDSRNAMPEPLKEALQKMERDLGVAK